MPNAKLKSTKTVLQMKQRFILYFIVVYCSPQVHCGQGPKIYFPFLKDETLSISENENVSLIFWLDTSACQDPSGDYRMEVETRRGDGGIEYDGKLARWNNTCIITSRRATRCTGDSGPAELFKNVNRSHTQFVVRWTWEDDESRDLVIKEKTIQLNFVYDAGEETVSRRTINEISGVVASLVIVILVLTVIIKWRRRTSCSKSKCETNDKRNDGGLLALKTARTHVDEDIKKQFTSKIWRIESHWLEPNTNQTKYKISVHQTALKHQQDELLELLLPDFPTERKQSL